MKEDFFRYQAQTTDFSMAFEVSHAIGSYIYDKKQKAYLDFAAGVSANTLGHSHPEIISAIKKQVDKHLHVMVYGEYIQDTPLALCKALANLTEPNLQTTYLVNSGAEAIDGAIKLAKRYTGRSKILSAKNSYHGNTHGALSVSGNEDFKRAYRPLLPDIDFIYFNDDKAVDQITTKTAAILLETIQGAAGFILPKKSWIQAIRKKCDETGTLLILDEIQPGFGRTGAFFAYQHFGIVPDILVMGKGMAGGMPIGAFMSSAKIMDSFRRFPKLGHITTFGGNPVVAAASLAVINELNQTDLIVQTTKKEEIFKQELQHSKILSIRGKGLMLGLELKSADYTLRVAKRCMDKGLIVFWLLYEGQFLRITPPLTLSTSEIKKGCTIIREVLDELD